MLAEPFAQGSRDLDELAGVRLTSKRVERSSEADGTIIQTAIEGQAQAVLAGNVIPLVGSAPIPKVYLAMDDTGVPAVPMETVGRRGKSPGGCAHTREVKLGCLLTQTNVDQQGRPVRGPGSSSYVASRDTAASFGALLSAEAQRRGVSNAEQLIALGYGAPWIMKLADEHSPGAVQVVGLYHIR